MALLTTAFGDGEVLVDPWSANEMLDDFQASNGWAYGLAIAESSPPRMFSGGSSDLPLFTASGLDPQLLMQMPALTRHALAAEASMQTVQAMFDQDSTNPHASYGHPSRTAAEVRIRQWGTGQPVTNVDLMNQQDDAKAVHIEQQRQIDQAAEVGGPAAANALIRKYTADHAARQAAADQSYEGMLSALNLTRTDRGQIVPGLPGGR